MDHLSIHVKSSTSCEQREREREREREGKGEREWGGIRERGHLPSHNKLGRDILFKQCAELA